MKGNKMRKLLVIVAVVCALACSGCGVWLEDIAQQWFPAKGGGDTTQGEGQ